MHIVDFQYSHISQAAALALEVYREECSRVPALSQMDDVPGLRDIADNELGVAAFEGDKMVGFLCCYPPFDHAFGSTDVRGVFSPMGANGAVPQNREKIYAAMYQAAGAKWVQAGAVSHAVCLYGHDEDLQRQFYRLGFGLRTMDAVRPMEEIDCKPCGEYEFAELAEEEVSSVYPLKLELNRHFYKSPVFMNCRAESREDFAVSFVREGARYFGAKQDGKLCAYAKITDTGETFAASGEKYRHINGAYCLPEYRGMGVYQNLLNFIISTLKAEKYTRLGVDFESFNPTAYGFWLKHFTPYTHGVVRRIDERILL